VTRALALRQIDHADRALQHRLAQGFGGGVVQTQEKAIQPGTAKQAFVTVVQCRAHPFVFHFGIPFRCCRNPSGVGGEADQQRFVDLLLANQLAEVPFAPQVRFGCPRVAQMRVVRPYHHLAGAATTDAVVGERQQGVVHVCIAQVPGVDAAAEHAAVITFRVDHHRRVALRNELRVDCRQAIVFEIGRCVALQLQQLCDNRVAGRWPLAGSRLIAVYLRLAHMIECGITFACDLRLIGIDLLQITDHRVGGAIQAIHVQTIETDAVLRFTRGVVGTQTADEIQHFAIAPHPLREAFEVVQRRFRIVVAIALHVAIDTQRVWPVGFDRHSIEAVLGNQPAGDLRAHTVELAGSVGCLAEQHEMPVRGHFQQFVVIARIPIQTPCQRAHREKWRHRRGHGNSPAPSNCASRSRTSSSLV